MFWTRLASIVVLAPLFLALVWLGSPYFDLLVAAIAGVMAWEFTRMDGKAGTKRRALIAAAALAAVFLASAAGPMTALSLIVLMTLALVAADQIAGRRGLNLLQAAIPYVALPAVSLIFVLRYGQTVSIFWVLAVVWATDIGAYICGRLIGGPKLAPAISPNKTWAGAIGGLAAGVAAAALVLEGFDKTVTPLILFLSAVTAVATEAGDLFESALKRRYHVKDTGGLIPGHGGVMDRFDGLWAASPVAAGICLVMNGGVQQW